MRVNDVVVLSVSFADVVKEIKKRYAGLNMKTASKEFYNLMEVTMWHHPEVKYQIRASLKLKLAFLITDAFTCEREN
jgi:hypothetical protein